MWLLLYFVVALAFRFVEREARDQIIRRVAKQQVLAVLEAPALGAAGRHLARWREGVRDAERLLHAAPERERLYESRLDSLSTDESGN